MDQVRKLLVGLKNYHFWIVIVIVLTLGIASWYKTADQLMQQFKGNKDQVGQAFQQAQSVVGIPNHPNDKFDLGMHNLIKTRGENVRQAWDLIYQRQGDILKWPEELREDFLEKVRSMRLIEQVDPENPQHQLRISLRERYRDYIKNELPKLAQMIGAEWNVAGETDGGGVGQFGGFGFGGGAAGRRQPPARTTEQEPTRTESIVHWNPQNQAEIQSRRFDWTHLPEKAPSTLQVLYAQEDLWVLRSLMLIIERTNGGVKARHLAAIKEIDFIRIGKDVAGPIGQVHRVVGEETDTAGQTRSTAGARPSEGGMGQGVLGADPADGRYVDKNYLPLPVETLRAATQSVDPADAYLAVAKRIPVRMRLVMDSRKINKLLTECANSPLTLEVRQLRLNPSAGGTALVQSSDATMVTQGTGLGPFDVPVEIYGIIYIFNPVDSKKLYLDEEEIAEAQRGRNEDRQLVSARTLKVGVTSQANALCDSTAASGTKGGTDEIHTKTG